MTTLSFSCAFLLFVPFVILVAPVLQVGDFGFAFGVDSYDKEIVKLLFVDRWRDVGA